jgi:hypothetical protein
MQTIPEFWTFLPIVLQGQKPMHEFELFPVLPASGVELAAVVLIGNARQKRHTS